MGLFFIATFFLLFVSSAGNYYFENLVQPEQFGFVYHCLWWSKITLIISGWGDVYPTAAGGRIFTSFIVIIGLGIVAYQLEGISDETIATYPAHA